MSNRRSFRVREDSAFRCCFLRLGTLSNPGENAAAAAVTNSSVAIISLKRFDLAEGSLEQSRARFPAVFWTLTQCALRGQKYWDRGEEQWSRTGARERERRAMANAASWRGGGCFRRRKSGGMWRVLLSIAGSCGEISLSTHTQPERNRLHSPPHNRQGSVTRAERTPQEIRK